MPCRVNTHVKLALFKYAGGPGPDKISGIFMHVESNYAGLEGMSEGIA